MYNVDVATMAQIYPEDRGTNYAIRDGAGRGVEKPPRAPGRLRTQRKAPAAVIGARSIRWIAVSIGVRRTSSAAAGRGGAKRRTRGCSRVSGLSAYVSGRGARTRGR